MNGKFAPRGAMGPTAIGRNDRRVRGEGARGMRASAYLRNATSAPGFRPLKEQAERIKAYAASRGMILQQIYADSNSSGMVIQSRLGLLTMLNDAAAGRFDVLLVQDIDRLGRGPMVAEILTRLTSADVPAVDINGRILGPTDVLLAEISPQNKRKRPFGTRGPL